MISKDKSTVSIAHMMDDIGRRARRSAAMLAGSTGEQRDAALRASAASIRQAAGGIAEANRRDLVAATG